MRQELPWACTSFSIPFTDSHYVIMQYGLGHKSWKSFQVVFLQRNREKKSGLVGGGDDWGKA